MLLPMIFIGTCLLTCIAAGAKSVKEAQSYMSVLMLLPMIPTIVLMVNPVKNQLWMLTVPFLAQNQMILKLVRSEPISTTEWAVYLAAGFGLGAAAVVRRGAPLSPGAAGDLGLNDGSTDMKPDWRKLWKDNKHLVFFIVMLVAFKSSLADWNSLCRPVR